MAAFVAAKAAQAVDTAANAAFQLEMQTQHWTAMEEFDFSPVSSKQVSVTSGSPVHPKASALLSLHDNDMDIDSLMSSVQSLMDSTFDTASNTPSSAYSSSVDVSHK